MGKNAGVIFAIIFSLIAIVIAVKNKQTHPKPVGGGPAQNTQMPTQYTNMQHGQVYPMQSAAAPQTGPRRRDTPLPLLPR